LDLAVIISLVIFGLIAIFGIVSFAMLLAFFMSEVKKLTSDIREDK